MSHLNSTKRSSALFAVAPMMGYTDRHCRFFHRLLSKRALLYSEMITANAIVFGDSQRLIGHELIERPVAIQLGGGDPKTLGQAAVICSNSGYCEINLNVGCPSLRVKSGNFGACLMLNPELVGECVSAIKARVDIPVTVKCRLGVDDQDPEIALDDLADSVIAAGGDGLIVHARKAWLAGLSPKHNRTIPPLDYERVYRLKARVKTELPVTLNGGITTMILATEALTKVDGVMIGRAAYQNPHMLARVDADLYHDDQYPDLLSTINDYVRYATKQATIGVSLAQLAKPLIGLFKHRPDARRWRRALTGANHDTWLTTAAPIAARIINACDGG